MNTIISKCFTILIVDDNLKNLQVLGKILKEEKYEIEFAIDGEATFEWLKTKKFDLILLDINMPGMNGFEVCNKIRSDPSNDKVPVIFLSAETERESILKGFEVGAQDYVTKPFDKRELLARVKTHLALKESRENLEELNTSLEKKVQERTRQLTDAYRKLEVANLKLEDIDKSKTEFMHMISHEIRTPLNGIVGPMYLLKEKNMSPEVVALVEVLDHSVRRLERFSLIALLITQLRTLGEKMSKKNIHLADLVNSCISDSETNDLFKEKGIKINEVKISKEIVVYGNFDLLKTCITNILENSIKYSDLDSTIQVKIIQDSKMVILEIEDEGYGFPENSIENINNMLSSDELVIDFHVGLGLNLVKFIMANHLGKVEVVNKNPGACVKLFFKIK